MYRGDLARDGHPATATLTAAAIKRLKAVWQAELVGPVNGTPVVSGGVVVAASAGGVVAAFNLKTGTRIWQADGFGRLSGSPTIAGKAVIFTESRKTQETVAAQWRRHPVGETSVLHLAERKTARTFSECA